MVAHLSCPVGSPTSQPAVSVGVMLFIRPRVVGSTINKLARQGAAQDVVQLGDQSQAISKWLIQNLCTHTGTTNTIETIVDNETDVVS